MTVLPEPPTASAAGQATNLLTDSVIQAAVNDALQKTFHRDDSPVPLVGTAPPVAQPGRPPMSQKAVDDSTRMLSFGVMTTLVGGTASLVMVASGHADPTVCGIVFGAPPVFALTLSRLVRRVKETVEAAPPEHHHHYSGPVNQDQRNVHTSTRGVWAKTNNQR